MLKICFHGLFSEHTKLKHLVFYEHKAINKTEYIIKLLWEIMKGIIDILPHKMWENYNFGIKNSLKKLFR